MDVDSEKLSVYQLHILLLEVSPAIWRRLLVRADSTIAELHYNIQIAMGWSDVHLNRFLIHGAWYGVPRSGGLAFSGPSDKSLSSFEFRVGERFLYEYDLTACWRHQIRIENVLALGPKRRYPACIGGKRWGPAGDCGGPWRFMEQKEEYGLRDLVDGVKGLLESPGERIRDARGDIVSVIKWLDFVPFDRRSVNSKLQRHTTGEEVFELELE